MRGKTKQRTSPPQLVCDTPEQEAQAADCELDSADLKALEVAYEAYKQCSQHKRRGYYVYVWKTGTPLWSNICRGGGSTINLFPQTISKIGDFRMLASSANDAWSQDWYSFGADLYESLFKCLRTVHSNAGAVEPPSWEQTIEGAAAGNGSWRDR
jgi:hypothetical protein